MKQNRQIKRPEFAIDPKLDEIVRLIEKNEVVIVDVPTGCGKSIALPPAICKTFRQVRIHVSQPTRAAVLGLYEFQKNFVTEGLGWAAEGQRKYKDTDRIVYATAGHIKHSVLRCFKDGKALDMTFCDALMLDEIHTGSKDLSIIVDLWCKAKEQGVQVPKLILSTATASGISDLIARLKAVVFSSSFRKTSVEIRYNRANYDEPDDESLLEKAALTAADLLGETRQHGIVFCSGANECEDMIQAIKELVESRRYEAVFGKKINVIPCYSQCKPEEIMLAISAAPKDTIHVVCATNVAESSLTIPDVKWVVDTLSEKRSIILRQHYRLAVTWISKNSAEQRAGRTGRTVNNGICHRMMTKTAYEKLEQIKPLEIRNSSISDTLIELLDRGLDPCKIITELCPERLESAKKALIDTGCINLISHDDDSLKAEVTKCGRFAVQLPMDVHNAAALYYCIYGNGTTLKGVEKNANIFTAVAVATLVDTFGPSPFWFPRRGKDEDPKSYQMRLQLYAHENFEEYMSECPLESLLSYFMKCMSECDGNIYAKPWHISKWASKNSGNAKKLKEVCINMKQILYKVRDDFDVEYKPDVISKTHIKNTLNDIRRALTLTYESKILRPVMTQYGFGYRDNHLTNVNVDVVKTVCRSTPFCDLISLSDIEVQNKKTGKVTVISSLWIRRVVHSGEPTFELAFESSSDDSSEDW